MAKSLAYRDDSLGRMYRWFMEDSAKARIWIIVPIFIFAFLKIFFSVIAPDVRSVQTVDKIYLPQNAEVVQGVKNMFIEGTFLGGAGGIAATQIEVDISSYQAREKENKLHFITIIKEGSPSNGAIRIDYYGKNDDSSHIWHTYERFDSPPANRWYYFDPNNFSIKDGGLVVDRSIMPYGTTLTCVLIGIFLSIMAAFIANSAMGKLLNRIYIKSLKD